jgi:hypothetical protein
MNFKLLGNLKRILLLPFNSVTLTDIVINFGVIRLKLEIRNIGQLFYINYYKFLFGFFILIDRISKTPLLKEKIYWWEGKFQC